MRVLKKIILTICFLSLNLSVAQVAEDLKKERVYKIENITETKRYYLLKSKINTIKVILVVAKNSDQLPKKIKKGRSYKFETYKYWDVMAFGEYYHEVDSIEIWNSDMYPIELHFTDGMGNEFFEDSKTKK